MNKTKKKIHLAYKEILKDKIEDKISITEFCMRANISRNTFYLYYNNFNDLETDFFNEIKQKILSQVKVVESSNDLKLIISITTTLFVRVIYKNLSDIILYYKDREIKTIRYIRSIYEEALADNISNTIFESTGNTNLSFIVNGIVSSLIRYAIYDANKNYTNFLTQVNFFIKNSF